MSPLRRFWEWLCLGWGRLTIIDYRMKQAISNLEMLQQLDDLEAKCETKSTRQVE